MEPLEDVKSFKDWTARLWEYSGYQYFVKEYSREENWVIVGKNLRLIKYNHYDNDELRDYLWNNVDLKDERIDAIRNNGYEGSYDDFTDWIDIRDYSYTLDSINDQDVIDWFRENVDSDYEWYNIEEYTWRNLGVGNNNIVAMDWQEIWIINAWDSLPEEDKNADLWFDIQQYYGLASEYKYVKI